MTDRTVSVGHHEPSSLAIGPGRRFGLWVRGCRRRCPGCVSPELRPWGGPGHSVSVSELFRRIEDSRVRHGIEGVTFSGGEPFEQAPALAELAGRCRAAGLSVIAWSGHLLEELRGAGAPPGSADLLDRLDVLIDGPFIREFRCDLPLRGSSNQRLIRLTNRYREEDFRPRIVEARFGRDGYGITGVIDPDSVTGLLRLMGVETGESDG